MRSWILAMLIAFIAYLFFVKLNKWRPGVGMKFRKNSLSPPTSQEIVDWCHFFFVFGTNLPPVSEFFFLDLVCLLFFFYLFFFVDDVFHHSYCPRHTEPQVRFDINLLVVDFFGFAILDFFFYPSLFNHLSPLAPMAITSPTININVKTLNQHPYRFIKIDFDYSRYNSWISTQVYCTYTNSHTHTQRDTHTHTLTWLIQLT